MEEYYIIDINDIMIPISLNENSLRFKSFRQYTNVLNNQIENLRLERTFYESNREYLGKGETIVKKNQDGTYTELYSGMKINLVSTIYDSHYSDLHQDFEGVTYHITKCPENFKELSPLYINHLRKINSIEKALSLIYDNKNIDITQNIVNPLLKRMQKGEEFLLSQTNLSQKNR